MDKPTLFIRIDASPMVRRVIRPRFDQILLDRPISHFASEPGFAYEHFAVFQEHIQFNQRKLDSQRRSEKNFVACALDTTKHV